MPVGIDPGWDRNAGTADLAADARRALAEKATDAPAPVRAALADDLDSPV